jgi:hypothetical protein
MLKRPTTELLIATALAITGITRSGFGAGPNGQVRPLRTPNGGIQPQAVVDRRGVLNLIYFQGSPEAGNIYYVQRAPGMTAFSKPIRVNSVPGSAIAVGNVRGAQLAVGKNGVIHVSWLGSSKAEPRGPSDTTPMMYTRSNGARTTFEPERNLMQFATGLDGGGSVAADAFGHVYMAWHANPKHNGEAHRSVYLARSINNGRTFSREVQAYPNETGACGCCGMRIFADSKGNVYILYRAATQNIHRDMVLLVSNDEGKTFTGTVVSRWRLDACPMSTDFISQSPHHILIAWERAGQVYYGVVSPGTDRVTQVGTPPGGGQDRKHPVAVGNCRGDTLLVWTEGTAWQKGGALAWQVFSASGRPTAEKGWKAGVVPIWSLVTAFVQPDGDFTIVY